MRTRGRSAADTVTTQTQPGSGVSAAVDTVAADLDQGSIPHQRSRALTFVSDYAVFLIFILIIVAFSADLPHTFATMGNLRTIVNSQAVLLVLTLGLVVPLSIGEFDLSVGANLGMSSMMITWLAASHHWNSGLAVLAVAGVGLLVGAVNAFLVVNVGLDAFIATLGTMTTLDGLTLGISNGQILSGLPDAITKPVNAGVGGFDVPVFVAFGMALLLWYVLEMTPLGRHLYFIGAGPETARLVGLRVSRIRWGAFLTSGLVGSLAGIAAAGQLGGAVSGTGEAYLLPAYAAAFLGATTIRPGRFNAAGTVVALYLLVTGVTGLELLGAQGWIGQLFNGIALIAAVSFARATGKRKGG